MPKRYTISIPRKKAHAKISEVDQLVIDSRAQTSALGALPEWVKSQTTKLASSLASICDQYLTSRPVQSAAKKLGENRRLELLDLENLYHGQQKSNPRLYGFSEIGVEGSASIESEIRRLQNIVIQRYKVEVLIRILSVGVLCGNSGGKSLRAR